MSMKDFYMTALFHVMLHKAVLTQKEALYITWWNGRPGMDDIATGRLQTAETGNLKLQALEWRQR